MALSEHHILLKTKRGEKESHKEFEQRFSAQMAKLNSMGPALKLSSEMGSLIILGNAKVDSDQRISILVAASPKDENISPRSSLEDFMKAVDYETIAAVLRQCETSRTTASGRSTSYAHSSTATVGNTETTALSDNKYSQVGETGPYHQPGDPYGKNTLIPTVNIIELKNDNL